MAQQKPFKDRRHGPDRWIKSLSWISGTGWIIIISILLIIDKAKPQMETFFDRWFQLTLRNTWDQKLLQSTFFLMLGLLILNSMGLWINTQRNRRINDNYRISLIFQIIIALLGIIAFIISYF